MIVSWNYFFLTNENQTFPRNRKPLIMTKYKMHNMHSKYDYNSKGSQWEYYFEIITQIDKNPWKAINFSS